MPTKTMNLEPISFSGQACWTQTKRQMTLCDCTIYILIMKIKDEWFDIAEQAKTHVPDKLQLLQKESIWICSLQFYVNTTELWT